MDKHNWCNRPVVSILYVPTGLKISCSCRHHPKPKHRDYIPVQYTTADVLFSSAQQLCTYYKHKRSANKKIFAKNTKWMHMPQSHENFLSFWQPITRHPGNLDILSTLMINDVVRQQSGKIFNDFNRWLGEIICTRKITNCTMLLVMWRHRETSACFVHHPHECLSLKQCLHNIINLYYSANQ